MNAKFLDILKPQVLNFVKNASEQDCREILGPSYQDGFFEFIKTLRTHQEGQQIQFVLGFPDQATILPCFAFVLGNTQSTLAQQTISYENEEVDIRTWRNLEHLSATVCGESQELPPLKVWIYNTRLVIAAYSNNKLEVNWLIQLMDVILKMNQETFSVMGFNNMSSDTTDLRIQQELFPLKVPTRVMTVSFIYEQCIPLFNVSERHDFRGDTTFDFE